MLSSQLLGVGVWIHVCSPEDGETPISKLFRQAYCLWVGGSSLFFEDSDRVAFIRLEK